MPFIQKGYRVIQPKGNKDFQPHNTASAATRISQLAGVPNLLLIWMHKGRNPEIHLGVTTR